MTEKVVSSIQKVLYNQKNFGTRLFRHPFDRVYSIACNVWTYWLLSSVKIQLLEINHPILEKLEEINLKSLDRNEEPDVFEQKVAC